MEFPYHRLARSWRGYRWWKPLITGLIATGFYLVLSVVVAVVFIVLALLFPDAVGEPFWALIRIGFIDNGSPVVLAFSLGSLALLIPSLFFATLIMGPRPAGLLWSVAGRIRWSWMLRLLLPVAIAFGASFLFSLVVLPLLTGERIPPVRVSDDTWIVIVIAVLLVPLQAAAEEYVFRGFLMQTVGGWLKHPLFAILLPVPLFTLGHDYELWGLLDVTVFGIAAAYLAWRTGGLEASIMAHIVNNTVIFVVGALGLTDVNAKGGDWIEVLISALTLGLYCWLVIVASRRFGLRRTRTIDPASLLPQPVFVPVPVSVSEPVGPSDFVAPADWAPPAGAPTFVAPAFVAPAEWAPPVSVPPGSHD